MSAFPSPRPLAAVAAVLWTLACAGSAAAQSAPAAGLGDQLFATGGDITVEVLRRTAGLRSELRLLNPDGTFTSLAFNHEVGRVVTLPSASRISSTAATATTTTTRSASPAAWRRTARRSRSAS
jgi:hypothetical protein